MISREAQTLITAFLTMALTFIVIKLFSRKARVANAKLGSRRKEIFIAADVESVFARLSAMQGKYAAADRDPERKIVVLESPHDGLTSGFIFPAFLHSVGNGTRIHLGCHSKLFDLGYFTSKAHDACEAAIQTALAAPSARLVYTKPAA